MVQLFKYSGIMLYLVYVDLMVNYFCLLLIIVLLLIFIGFMVVIIFFVVCWICCQLVGQELLELCFMCILSGECGLQVCGLVYEWLVSISSVLDMLLLELQFVSDQCSWMDMFICFYVVQDLKIGLNNCLFFDNQLVMLLEDQEKVGVYGIVMMICLLEFDLLWDNWGWVVVEEYYFMFINLFFIFIMCYFGVLLVCYYCSDFVVLLLYCMLKEVDSIVGLLLKVMDVLFLMCIFDCDDMMYIGICFFCSG